jgi:EthD domain-containing protein
MIKVFGYLKRKPGLSPHEFAEYYEHNHVPLVLSKAFLPMVYKRNYIQRGDAFNIEGDEIGFDCMTELVFADRDDLSAWMASLGVEYISKHHQHVLDEIAAWSPPTTFQLVGSTDGGQR